MKKKTAVLFAVAVCLLICMTACAGEKKPELSGSYTSPGVLNQMNYTFDGESTVTVRFLVDEHSVFSQTGTYSLNKEGTAITFTFPVEESGVTLPRGMSSLSGVFTLKQEEDCIWIGTVCYQEDESETGTDESTQPDAGIASSPQGGEQ